VDIAVIDPRSKLLLGDQQMGSFNFNSSNTNFLLDFNTDLGRPGKLINFWQTKLNSVIAGQSLPRPAVSGIRVYERYFYLK